MVGEILVIGTGVLGQLILQELAYSSFIRKIIAADIDPQGEERMNYVLYTAMLHGSYPNLEFRKIDVNNVEETAELLKEINPDVICNATTLMSWWVYHLLPPEIVHKLNEAGMGPQIVFHLPLTYKLMKAVKKSGIHARVVNCSYSDSVNPVLSKVGLAPTCGGGNVGLYIPRIKQFISKETGIPMQHIDVYIYGHHGLMTSYWTAPYLIRIYAHDRDITNKEIIAKLEEFMRPFVRMRMGKHTTVPPNQHVAAAFARVILSIYGDTKDVCFVTGPQGLPGGYPARVGWEKVEVVLPNGVTIDDAIKANEESGRVGDGIEKIKDDGTVIFADKTVKIYREVLGYECKELKLNECEERAKELISIIQKRLQK